MSNLGNLDVRVKILTCVVWLIILTTLYNVDEISFLKPMLISFMFIVFIIICHLVYKNYIIGNNLISAEDFDRLIQYAYVIKKGNLSLNKIKNDDSKKTIKLGEEILKLIIETEDVMKMDKFFNIKSKYFSYLDYLDYATSTVNKEEEQSILIEKQKELKNYIKGLK